MTFDPNIPQSEPSPATQQPDVKTNFGQFASVFSSTSGGVIYNHTPLNSSNQGKHEAIILEKQVIDPVIAGNIVDIYNKNDQIFLRIPRFLPENTNTPIQLTYSTVNTAGPQYQSFLPGGYILYTGSSSGITSSASPVVTTITLSPAPSLILLPMAASNTMTQFGTPQPCGIGTQILNASQFNITLTSPSNGAAATYNITWFAIGAV